MAKANVPCPRLELRWEPCNIEVESIDCNWKCTYSLVFPLGEHDLRSTDVDGNPREMSLEIGSTLSRIHPPSTPVVNGEVTTPYRDGAHAQWDRDALGGHIPIVAMCGDDVTIVKVKPKT